MLDLKFHLIKNVNYFNQFGAKIQFSYLDVFLKVTWDVCFQVIGLLCLFGERGAFDFCVSDLSKYANKARD